MRGRGRGRWRRPMPYVPQTRSSPTTSSVALKSVNLSSLEEEGEVPVLTAPKYLGGFRIKNDMSCVKIQTEDELPDVVTDESVEDIRKQMPHLNDGFDGVQLIPDYEQYWYKKRDYLLDWILNDVTYHEEPPGFVAFNTAYVDLMTIPYSKKSWSMHATKYNGTIYFSVQRDEFSPPPRRSGPSSGQSANFKRMPHNFFTRCGLHFSQLLRNRKGQAEAEKAFALHNVQIVNQSILVLTEAHAVKSKQLTDLKFLDIKLVSSGLPLPAYVGEKCLEWWARGVISGTEKIIVGRRLRTKDKLEAVETLTIDQIPERCANSWRVESCVKSLKQMLDFMRECVEKDDPSFVHVFRKDEDSKVVNLVEITDSQVKHVLPDWFVKSFTDIKKSAQ